METIKTQIVKTPEITTSQIGQSMKILSVTGKAGMYMPPHCSTHETVVICLRGSAVLDMYGMPHYLDEGGVLVIPAQVIHSLTTGAGFKAFAIMDIKSSIIFENS